MVKDTFFSVESFIEKSKERIYLVKSYSVRRELILFNSILD